MPAQIEVFILGPLDGFREEVRQGLSSHPTLRMVGESSQLKDAQALLRKHTPDVIIADPLLGGSQDLGWIDEITPSIPIVLASTGPDLALLAFEKRVFDYLLRPLAESRVKLTIARLVEWKALHSRARIGRHSRHDEKILFQNRRESSLVRSDFILCIRAEGNYTNVLLQGGVQKLVHRSLQQWKRLLPPAQFVQIHRATLINVEHAHRLEKKAGRDQLHVTGCEEPLMVSRRMATLLKKRLKSRR